MAEADVMLAVIKVDVEGVQEVEVLDAKYTSLGSTFQKGQKRAEGAAEGQKKLTKAIKEGGEQQTKANVQTITNLALAEAATSGLNQAISAQYKSIDAKLAAGKIDEEEAERLRKSWKQREKHTARLETAIAVWRLWTVAKALATAMENKLTTATNLNTKALKANTAAAMANPWIRIVVIAALLTMYIVKLNKETGFLGAQFDYLNKKVEPLARGLDNFNESLRDLLTIDVTGSRLWGGIVGGD